MKNRLLSCRRARAALWKLADGELDLEQRFTLDAHLDDCQACRELNEGLALLDEGSARLAARGAQSGERLDVDHALARLDAALDDASVAATRARRAAGAPARRRLAFAAAAAALLGTVGFAAWKLLADSQPGGQPEEGFVAVGETGDEAGVDERPSSALATGSDEESQGVPVPLDDAAIEQAARTASTQRLAQALVREFGDIDRFDPGAREAAASRVDTALSDLVSSGWPLVRLVEGLLGSEGDESRVAAVLYLGARGDGASALRLGGRLDDQALSAPVLEALATLARRGVAGGTTGLHRALDRPEHAARAVELLGSTGTEDAARVLCRTLRSPRSIARLARSYDGQQDARDSLLEALVATGPAAVAPLFDLAAEARRGADRGLASHALLEAIALIDGHGTELAARLDSDNGTSLAFEAARVSADPALLPWLEKRAGTTRTSGDAVALLAELPGDEVVSVLARLARRDRFEPSVMEQVLERVLSLDANRVARWISNRDRQLVSADTGVSPRFGGNAARLELEAFARLLLATPVPDAGPALCALVMAESLPSDDRTWAALALVDLGGEEDVLPLLNALEADAERTPVDARLLAAQLLAFRQALGERAVLRGLAARGVVRVDDVLQAMNEASERGNLAVAVHQVARALDDRRGAGLAQLQRRN